MVSVVYELRTPYFAELLIRNTCDSIFENNLECTTVYNVYVHSNYLTKFLFFFSFLSKWLYSVTSIYNSLHHNTMHISRILRNIHGVIS